MEELAFRLLRIMLFWPEIRSEDERSRNDVKIWHFLKSEIFNLSRSFPILILSYQLLDCKPGQFIENPADLLHIAK
jgi:hypothetical protein